MSQPTSKPDSGAPSPEAQSNDMFHIRPPYLAPHIDNSPQHQGSEPLFTHSGNHSLYNSHLSSDYLSHSDVPESAAVKLNDLAPGPFRSSFTTFNGINAVHSPNNTASNAPPGSFRMRQADSFVPEGYGTHQSFLKHHLPAHVHQGSTLSSHLDHRGVDVGNNLSLNTKASQPFVLDSLVQSHAVKAQLQPQAHDPFLSLPHSSAVQLPYLNGFHVQSQTPYGPHLQSNGGAMANNRGVGAGGQSSGAVESQGSQQEEISTIFVVGFPDDMQEREFQNMFTFSPGFEAATLKIPNREYTAYGSGATASNAPPRGGSYVSYLNTGQNDPYNIVTVNQGGVVVDNGRDGHTASWPPLPVPLADEPTHFQATSGGQPPRKQIIGFAKFRTRQEALEARDVLQGRRIDVEKGAVLKAEMAKKNLHTKRGVGIGSTNSGGGNALGTSSTSVGGLNALNGLNIAPDALAGLAAGLNLNASMGLGSVTSLGGSDVLAARELGYRNLATGWQDGRLGESSEDERERDREADRERRREALGAVGLGLGMGTTVTRGARERAMVEEELRRKDVKQAQNDSLRMHSTASDAFHSVSPMPRNTQGGFFSPSVGNDEVGHGSSEGSVPFNGNGFGSIIAQTSMKGEGTQGSPDVSVGPWDLPSPREREALAYAGMPFFPRKGAAVPARPSSSQGSSPSKSSLVFSPMFSGEEMLPPHRLRTTQFIDSPADEVVLPPPSSGAKSSGGATPEGDGPVPLVVCTSAKASTGSTSPQLPSPASHSESCASSNGGHAGSPSSAVGHNAVGGTGPRNALVDQNPPINTLYVGNLPTGSVAGYPMNHLEDSLRELFSRRPGYRKLCFRQKSNGPMCFVEFEDVHYATKALNELYGQTLSGQVKNGGIRLSYSKNPLGVRTPTGAGTGSSSLQQNGQLGTVPTFAADAFPQRQGFEVDAAANRRESTNAASPNPSAFGFPRSPPPPRFFSPPPASGNFGITPTSTPLNATFPRGTHSFGLSLGGAVGPSNFSPFGLPLSSPHTGTPPSHSMTSDHTGAETLSHGHPQHFPHRALSPSTTTLEAARAG